MPATRDRVVEFIRRRFPCDCRWTNGNCYYFAVILKDRFPDGRILYDTVSGHFVTEIDGLRYDWTGVVDDKDGKDGKTDRPVRYVAWDGFAAYDRFQYKRVVRDCTM